MPSRPPRENAGRDRRTEPTRNDFILPLPKRTAARIAERQADSDNVGLWLDKLIWRKKNSYDLKAKERAFSLSQLCRAYRSEAAAQAAKRLEETASAAHGKKRVHVFRAKVHGRLLVGYGRTSAAETAITFHRLWGAPVIPGSALKGITRARMALEGADSAVVESMFGHQERRGRLVFYDALPDDGRFELGLDVLTPHMREYYEGNAPPADWISPQPFTFLTVIRTTFVFVVGADLAMDERALALREKEAAESLPNDVAPLKQALKEDGVGAKTAAGYGRLVTPESAEAWRA